MISDVFILTYSVLLCEHISEKPSSARYPDRRRRSLPMTSMMSAGASSGNGHTGAVTIIAFMVITAVLTPVMGMPSCFCASFHRTDRTAGIRRGLSVMSAVPMSRNRHSQKDRQKSGGHGRSKPSANMHASPLLSPLRTDAPASDVHKSTISRRNCCKNSIAQRNVRNKQSVRSGKPVMKTCFLHTPASLRGKKHALPH